MEGLWVNKCTVEMNQILKKQYLAVHTIIIRKILEGYG
jgi:hypothetical protein